MLLAMRALAQVLYCNIKKNKDILAQEFYKLYIFTIQVVPMSIPFIQLHVVCFIFEVLLMIILDYTLPLVFLIVLAHLLLKNEKCAVMNEVKWQDIL